MRSLLLLIIQQQVLGKVLVLHIQEIRSFVDILHIKFVKLQYLHLTGISLDSTEQLNRIYCPVLYKLWIGTLSKYVDKNKITSIESFRKTYWLNLGFVIMSNFLLNQDAIMFGTVLPSPKQIGRSSLMLLCNLMERKNSNYMIYLGF